MWRGEQKRARCPAWVRGRIGRHPTFKKRSQPGGSRARNLKQNTLKLTQQFSLASLKFLNTILMYDAAAKLKWTVHFVIFLCCFCPLKQKRIGTKSVPSLYAMEWHFSRHAFCTLASSFIRNYSESKFSFSPARGHKNGPTTRRLRGTFLSSSIQFAYEKESAAALAVARTQGRCKSDAWWETFIRTASEWFYYWREINSGPRKLIPRKSVPTLSQPYDHIYPVLWRTGRMPCSFFFIWDTLVTHLSALSKSTLIRTRVFPWHRGGWGKKKEERKKMSTKNQTPSSPALWRKAWLWHLLFSFTWTLHKWTRFHTFQPPLRTTQYDFTTHVTSSSEASANGYHTREVWRASIHSHKKKKPYKQSNPGTHWSHSYGHWRYS